MSLHLKVKFKDTVRRLSCKEDESFENLSLILCKHFGVNPKAVILKYTDDEEDEVCLSSDLELAEARRLQPQVLRLQMYKVTSIYDDEPFQEPVVGQESSEEKTSSALAPLVTSNLASQPEEISSSDDDEEAAEEPQEVHQTPTPAPKTSPKSSPATRKPKKKPRKPKAFDSQFVRDVTMKDGSEVTKLCKFTKVWRIKNVGTQAWPSGCRLVQVDPIAGLIGTSAGVSVSSLAPGNEVDVEVVLVAPKQPGRYMAYFRLQSPDDAFFGQRLWVDVCVVEPSVSARPQPSKKEKPTKWDTQLEQLQDMGFKERDVLLFLLDTHKGDMAKVMEHLLSAVPNDS